MHLRVKHLPEPFLHLGCACISWTCTLSRCTCQLRDAGRKEGTSHSIAANLADDDVGDANPQHDRVVVRLQDFPYHLDPDVEHHNVWSTCALSEAELHKVLELVVRL